jgi:hypothetical protein
MGFESPHNESPEERRKKELLATIGGCIIGGIPLVFTLYSVGKYYIEKYDSPRQQSVNKIENIIKAFGKEYSIKI